MNWERGLLRTGIVVGVLGIVVIVLYVLYKSVAPVYLMFLAFIALPITFLVGAVIALFLMGWGLLWIVRGFQRD